MEKAVEEFKIDYARRWISSFKIQRWWKRVKIDLMDRGIEPEFRKEIERNYCHCLEFIMASMTFRQQGHLPFFLYNSPKFKDLLDIISYREGIEWKSTDGIGPIYCIDFINDYVRRNNLPRFNHFLQTVYPADKIIFVSRGDSKKRRLTNEQDLIHFLKKNIPSLQVATLNDSTLAFSQARMFSNCSTIIGVHGAGLANMMFMPKWSNVYEISPGGKSFHYFDIKAMRRGLNHCYIPVEEYVESEECEVFPRDCYMTMKESEMEYLKEQLILDAII